MLVRPMITDPAAIRIRALIPDHHAALRTGRAMSMPRLELRSLPATGLPSASGTVMPGASAACASAADQVAAVSVPRPAARRFQDSGEQRGAGLGEDSRTCKPVAQSLTEAAVPDAI